MAKSAHYHRDHLIAKIIVYVVYLLIGVLSIELATPYVALVAGTFIWLFGVNTAAYLVECCCGHQHSNTLV